MFCALSLGVLFIVFELVQNLRLVLGYGVMAAEDFSPLVEFFIGEYSTDLNYSNAYILPSISRC